MKRLRIDVALALTLISAHLTSDIELKPNRSLPFKGSLPVAGVFYGRRGYGVGGRRLQMCNLHVSIANLGSQRLRGLSRKCVIIDVQFRRRWLNPAKLMLVRMLAGGCLGCSFLQ